MSEAVSPIHSADGTLMSNGLGSMIRMLITDGRDFKVSPVIRRAEMGKFDLEEDESCFPPCAERS